MYCRAHKTATLTPIQHTVPPPHPHFERNGSKGLLLRWNSALVTQDSFIVPENFLIFIFNDISAKTHQTVCF